MQVKTTTVGGPKEDVDTILGGDLRDPAMVVGAFEELVADEKRKLMNVECLLRGGTSFGSGELFRDALTRAVLGERRWPGHVPFMAFMVETMRSIAYHERARLKRSVPLDDIQENVIAKGASSGGSPLTPENQMMSAEIVKTIHSHFDGDDEATLLLMGWGDGLRGRDLREFVGMNQPDLDYLAKRVRRTLWRVYPNGWEA